MGRRTVILVVALVIALVGSAMVYLYVRGADERAQAEQEPVEVLKAVAQIEPGESLSQAQAAGKLELQPVPREQLLEGVMDSVGESGSLVALSRVFPNEQVTTSKFGAPGEQDQLALERGEIAISVDLTDTGRVAGFVAPGSNVAVFASRAGLSSRLLLREVKIIAVGQTTVTTSTTTAEGGEQTTEQLPRTLITLAVDQGDAQKVLAAIAEGMEISFGLLTDQSKVRPGPGVNAGNIFG
jgi:pilus assembly protein CpaB